MKAACLLMVALFGCGSLDQFDIELSAQATIPGTASSIPGVPVSQAFPGGAEISQRIKNKGVKPSDVETAKLTSGALRVLGPEDGHLSYLQSLELYVEADGFGRKRIAAAGPAAFSGKPTRVELTLDDVELQPYVTAPAMKIVPQVERDPVNRPFQDIEIALDLTLFVDLTIFD